MKCIYIFNKNVVTWLIELQFLNMKILDGPKTLHIILKILMQMMHTFKDSCTRECFMYTCMYSLCWSVHENFETLVFIECFYQWGFYLISAICQLQIALKNNMTLSEHGWFMTQRYPLHDFIVSGLSASVCSIRLTGRSVNCKRLNCNLYCTVLQVKKKILC